MGGVPGRPRASFRRDEIEVVHIFVATNRNGVHSAGGIADLKDGVSGAMICSMRFRVVAFAISSSLAGCMGEPVSERCDPMPRAVTYVQPDLPPGVMHHFGGGSIVVEFVIEKSGVVRDPVVVESNIERYRADKLNGAVYEAMSHWRYGSRSKSCRARMSMEFKLVD